MRIKCLDYCCQEQCSEQIIRSILNVQDFQRYKRFTNAYKVDTNKNLIFCPSKDCSELIDKSGKGPVQCKVCQTQACAKCDLLKHQGKCVKANDKQFKFWALGTKLGVKNCPKCKSRTEKTDGCNHMTCARCTAEWCWICNQQCSHEHFEMNFKNLMTGCPGLQFTFEGGGWQVFLSLFAVWWLNIPVFVLIPLLIGLLLGLVTPYAILFWMWSYVAACYRHGDYKRRRNRRRRGQPQIKTTCNFVKKAFVVLVVIPIMLVVTQVSFSTLLLVCMGFWMFLAALVAGVMVVFVSPVLMLFIPYYTIRLACLTIKGLR